MKWFRRTGDKASETARDPAADAGGLPAETGSAPLLPENGTVPEQLADFFLVLEEHLTDIEREDMAGIVERLRKPPTVLDRVSRGLDDPQELAETVLTNPALSADVLRIVNSAAFQLNSPISSVHHAVNYLGTNLVKGLVLQAAVDQMLPTESPAQHTAYMRLWRASFVASAVAQALARDIGLPDPTELATKALLVNIGDLALVLARPELASLYGAHATLFDRVAGQQEAIIGNSAIIGATLARAWNLPAPIEAHLRFCHVPMAWPPERHGETDLDIVEHTLVYFANRVGDAVTFGASRELGDFTIVRPDALEYHFLPAYLIAADLTDLPARLARPQTADKLQQLINRFGK